MTDDQTNIEWIKDALKRIEAQLLDGSDRCRERHATIDRELGALSVRATVTGAIAGLIAGGSIAVIELIFRIVN